MDNQQKKEKKLLAMGMEYSMRAARTSRLHRKTNIEIGLVGWVLTPSRETRWTIADGLGLYSKNVPRICHHNFDLPRRGWLPRFGNPRGII